MHLVYNRFYLTIVHCINLFEAQQSLSSYYILSIYGKKKFGFDKPQAPFLTRGAIG